MEFYFSSAHFKYGYGFFLKSGKNFKDQNIQNMHHWLWIEAENQITKGAEKNGQWNSLSAGRERPKNKIGLKDGALSQVVEFEDPQFILTFDDHLGFQNRKLFRKGKSNLLQIRELLSMHMFWRKDARNTVVSDWRQKIVRDRDE